MKDQKHEPNELPTKSQFVVALRQEMIERFENLSEDQVNEIMANWSVALRSASASVITGGPAFMAACRKLRLDPRSTITFLRTLPD